MILQEFTYGLNLRKAPELLSPQEATVCDNVNIASGTIKPELGLGPALVGAPTGASYWAKNKAAFFPNADMRDYLEYRADLYWTSPIGAAKLLGAAQQPLGIAPPKVAPTVTFPPIPSVLLNNFWIDLLGTSPKVWTGIWTPVVSPAQSALVAAVYSLFPTPIAKVLIYNAPAAPIAPVLNTLWLNTTTVVAATPAVVGPPATPASSASSTVLQWDGVAWIATSAAMGTTFANAWLTPGGAQPFQTVYVQTQPPSLVLDSIQYVYTYYNILDGTESAPSPLSPIGKIVNFTVASTSIAIAPVLDPQVTHVFIYRIGGALLKLTKVKELLLPLLTTVDNLPTINAVGNILTSEPNLPPPVGLRYLTLSQGVFFGAVLSKVYFSRDIGNPNYWPAVNYIDFHAPITALAATTNGVVVFTKYTTHLLLGSTVANMIQYLVSPDQGCTNYKAVAKLNNQVLFPSTDGICVYSGGHVKLITLDKLGVMSLATINAVLFDQVYHCGLVGGRILRLDFRFGFTLSYLVAPTLWLTEATETLLLAITQLLPSQPLYKGLPLTYSYSSGLLIDRIDSELKVYDKVYIKVKGPTGVGVTVSVYIDELLVMTKALLPAAKPQVLSVPQTKQRGSNISFSLVGTAEVTEIEYKTYRRQNGR